MTIGDYEIIKEIGSGTQSTVYLARHMTLDIPIVLKVLRADMAEDQTLVERFEREARTMAKLPHENIVRVTDFKKVRGQYYIAMEYVEGTDLRKWMKENGEPPVEIAILMLRDICRGLAVAHHVRPDPVVHRDIKPANMMFSRTGVIKIMDFGLARVGAQSVDLTVVDTLLGSVAYMSPEQAERRNRDLDVRSDIFSTGILAYELLSGRRPFNGKDSEEVLEAIRTRTPHWLGGVNPEVPDEAVRIVHRMLQKDKAARPPDIAEIHGELEDLIAKLDLQRRKNWLGDYYESPGAIEESLHPKRISRHLAAGAALMRSAPERFEDALREFRSVLELDPGNAEADSQIVALRERHLKLGMEYVGAGPERFDDAHRELRRVLSVQHDNGEALRLLAGLRKRHLDLGLGNVEQGRLDEAEVDLNRALSIAPDDPVAAAALAEIQARRPKPPEEERKPAPPSEDQRQVSQASATTKEDPGPPGPADDGRKKAIRRLLLIGSVLLGLVVALLVLWAIIPKETPEGTLIVTVSPEGAMVLVDGQVQGDRNGIRLSAGEHTVRVELEGYEPQTRSLTLGRSQTARATFALQPVYTPPETTVVVRDSTAIDTTATLIVTTVPPEARVRVDGQQVERDTAGTIRGLGPGVRRVTVELQKFVSQSRNVTLTAASSKSLHFVLDSVKTSPGFLSIHIAPPHPIYSFSVDGQNQASNQASVQVTVAPGRRRIEVKAGYVVWDTVVRVPSKDTLRVSHRFPAGCLVVRSKGNWARVYLNGKDTGRRTGEPICDLIAAQYQVRVERQGYRTTQDTVVEIRDGVTTTVDVAVEKQR